MTFVDASKLGNILAGYLHKIEDFCQAQVLSDVFDKTKNCANDTMFDVCHRSQPLRNLNKKANLNYCTTIRTFIRCLKNFFMALDI